MKAQRGLAGYLALLAIQSAHADSQTAVRTRTWSCEASAYYYVVRDDRDYTQPTLSADRDWLHLEGRYNYEDLDTGSLWMGYHFSGGGKLDWEVTPMLGGVFGGTSGYGPGFLASLTWGMFDVYSEGEYIFDRGDFDSSFYYSWSEVALTAPD